MNYLQIAQRGGNPNHIPLPPPPPPFQRGMPGQRTDSSQDDVTLQRRPRCVQPDLPVPRAGPPGAAAAAAAAVRDPGNGRDLCTLVDRGNAVGLRLLNDCDVPVGVSRWGMVCRGMAYRGWR